MEEHGEGLPPWPWGAEGSMISPPTGLESRNLQEKVGVLSVSDVCA